MSQDKQTSFEQQMMSAVQKAVLGRLENGDWLMPSYESRVKIPAKLIQEAWEMVDVEGIKKSLAARLQNELADRLVNHMAAEIATDIKQLLGDKETRERIRAVCREHLIHLCKKDV